MPSSHMPPPYCRQDQTTSFAKGAWQGSLSSLVKVCFRCSRTLGPDLKKNIKKLAKLFILTAGYLFKNRAAYLKLGDSLLHSFRLKYLIIT